MPTRTRHREKWLLLAPALLLLSLISLLPFLQTVWTSLTDARITALERKVSFIGLENYIWALTDPDFVAALGRTLYFTAVSVGLEGALGIAVALLLNQRFRGRMFLRIIIILPWRCPQS